MTAISPLSLQNGHQLRNSKSPGGAGTGTGRSILWHLLLTLACFWPLLVFGFLAILTKDEKGAERFLDSNNELNKDLRFNVRSLLDRVDVVGYGPTHPRIGVVVVGEDNNKILNSVESVFRNTALERIFLVCVVVDGRASDAGLEEALEKVDNGSSPHWHGLRSHVHEPGDESGGDDQGAHGSRILVLFNKEKQGIAESRAYAVDFIHLLAEKHEKAGLKSSHEDLLLLLLQSGARLTDRNWLSRVTGALIVPPPIIQVDEDTENFVGSIKLANAVAFNTEGPGRQSSFDVSFKHFSTDSHSTAASYPTPAWNGVAIAMRLETYRSLPAQDGSLEESWPADLELSLNLWLCADGIDMLEDLSVTTFEATPRKPLPPALAARFAAAWMDPLTSESFYYAYSKNVPNLTYSEWKDSITDASAFVYFPSDMPRRCRPFTWYAETINTDLAAALEIGAREAKEAKKWPVGELQEQQAEAAKRKLEQKGTEMAKPAVDAVSAGKAAAETRAAKVTAAPAAFAAAFFDRPCDGCAKPSKPLSQRNLQIIRQATPIDLTFVDVSGGHADHPHKGAKDENGNWGYVHDATALRKNLPSSTFVGQDLIKACAERDPNYRMIHEKVVVDFKAHQEADAAGMKRDKIFCFVYTHEKGHLDIPPILQTWGPHCDGFMVGSTKTDRALGTVEIPHEGPEEYNNIWQKVRSLWSYVYDNYYNDFDWFHIGGDDLLLIVENLRLYLESEEIKTAANGGIYLPKGDETVQVPLFLGRRFALNGVMNLIFNSGGSGYTINKAALKQLVVHGFPIYFQNEVTFSEDTKVAAIFRRLGTVAYDTKDEFGGERYMPFPPAHHLTYKIPKPDSGDWYAKYSIDIKEGLDHCATQSIAFHYIKGPLMYRLFALLYNQCPVGTA